MPRCLLVIALLGCTLCLDARAADPPRIEGLSNPQSQTVGKRLCNGNVWVPYSDPCPGSGSGGAAPSGGGPVTPTAPRPTQLTPAERQQQQRSEEDVQAYVRASRGRAEAAVSEAEKLLFGKGPPEDRAKAIQAYLRACAEVWAQAGCGMAAELQFDDLELKRDAGTVWAGGPSYRAEATRLVALAEPGCKAQEVRACFVQRRIRMSLGESYLGADLKGQRLTDFAAYDESKRNEVREVLGAQRAARAATAAQREAAARAAEERRAEEAQLAVVYAGASPAARLTDDHLRSEKPIEQLQEALRLDPNYFPAWLFLAWQYRIAKDVDKSANALRQAEKVCPEDPALRERRMCFDEPYLWESVGAAWREIGRLPEAERALLRSVQAYSRPVPANATEDQRRLAEQQQLASAGEPLLQLAEVRRLAHRPREAMALVDKLMTSRPRNPDLWRVKGDVLLDLGQFEAALGAHRKAVELGPVSFSKFEIGVAEALCANGQREEALAMFARLLKGFTALSQTEEAKERCLNPRPPPVSTAAVGKPARRAASAGKPAAR